MNNILNRFNGKVICEGKESIRELAEENKADLSWANLSGAYLSGADLSGAYLSGAYLSGANLSRAKNIEFYYLPSLGTLSKISLFNLSDALQIELMRRDAQAHPHPELFDEWVSSGKCPYQNEERFWLFEPNPKLWKSGKPKMTDFQLILEICRSQGWRVRGYLEKL